MVGLIIVVVCAVAITFAHFKEEYGVWNPAQIPTGFQIGRQVFSGPDDHVMTREQIAKERPGSLSRIGTVQLLPGVPWGARPIYSVGGLCSTLAVIPVGADRYLPYGSDWCQPR